MPVIFQMDPATFGGVRSLFQDLDAHLATVALLAGAAPGAVYVDDPSRPRSALAEVGHRLFLAGSAEAVVPTFLTAALDWTRAARGTGTMIYYTPSAWEDCIEAALVSRRPVRRLRHYYRFRDLRHDWRSLLPSGFLLRRVDGDLLCDQQLGNVGRLTEEVSAEGPSTEHFLWNCFGFCILAGSEIVAWCLSEYNTGDRIEVGIETVEPYRRQGLATVAASTLIEHALEQGVLEIGWHCHSTHVASIATARKVGFEQAGEYPVYWLPPAPAAS